MSATSGSAGDLIELERLQAAKTFGQLRRRGVFVDTDAFKIKLRKVRHIGSL